MSSAYEGKTLEQFNRSRYATIGVTTKVEVKIRPILDKEKEKITTIDHSYLRAVDKQLEKRLEDAGFLNAALLILLPIQTLIWRKIWKKLQNLKQKLVRSLTKLAVVERIEMADPVLTTTTSNPTLGKLKMPKFELPKFSCQYKDWTHFHEQFVISVHANSTIPDVQKFNYLKACLSGEALQLVSLLPLSNSNYHIALKSLTNRYNNQRLIVNSHPDTILQMKPLNGESASELRRLFVNFEENLMAIEALGVQTETCDFIWIRILSKRLDQESRRQWEIDYPGKEFQTFDQLREFINKRVQALEASNSGGKGQRIEYASNPSGKL